MSKAVFICSAGHSGSTLLDLLLGSHSRAASLGEITQLPKNLAINTFCTCGERVRSCPVWADVLERLGKYAEFSDLPENPYALNIGLFKASTVVDSAHQTRARLLYRKLVYGLSYLYLRTGVTFLSGFASTIDKGARNKLTLFDVVSEVMSKDILIDSSKHYLEAVALYRAAPSRVRLIVLIRDGRAVYYSGLKRGYSRKAAVDAWRLTYLRAMPLLKKHVGSGHLLKVHYEKLTADPERELQRICQFLDEPFEPQMLEFASKVHHITNGNNMRFSKDSRIRLDAGWEKRLSNEDLVYFERRAGKLNRALGYHS